MLGFLAFHTETPVPCSWTLSLSSADPNSPAETRLIPLKRCMCLAKGGFWMSRYPCHRFCMFVWVNHVYVAIKQEAHYESSVHQCLAGDEWTVGSVLAGHPLCNCSILIYRAGNWIFVLHKLLFTALQLILFHVFLSCILGLHVFWEILDGEHISWLFFFFFFWPQWIKYVSMSVCVLLSERSPSCSRNLCRTFQ